jgi:membrane dipeptidase
MISRNWTDEEVIGLMGGNLLRVMDEVDQTAHEMEKQGLKPSPAIWEDRKDLPMDEEKELPEVVRKYLREKTADGTLRAGLRELK